MEDHAKALAVMCRICKQIITSSRNKSGLARYKTELLAVYELNVDEEDKDIHPSSMCNKCRKLVQRTHNSMEHGKQYQGKLPQLGTFCAHDRTCQVCSVYAAHMSQLHPQFQGPSTSTATQALPSQPSLSSTTRTLFQFRIPQTVPDPGMASHGRKRIYSAKASLKDVRRDHAHKRTKEAALLLSDFCERQKEDNLDLLYFLLCDNLQGYSDSRYKEVLASWNKETTQLTAEDCLAMRVTTKTSKSHYQMQYQNLKAKGISLLKPPHALTELEKTFMPGSVRFRIEGGADIIHQTPVKKGLSHMEYGEMSFEPLDINGAESPGLEVPFPNMKGVAWPYPHALAKTLEELDEDIVQGLRRAGLDPNDDHVIHTTVKDGADGMGDISVTKASRDRLLPDKAFRAAFAVINCEVDSDGERVTIYEPEAPDSIFITRPLIEAIADENNRSTAAVILHHMESNRELLQGKELSVNVQSIWRRHHLKFFNSMIDEKLDRADGGLQGSGSRFMCTLCHATRETAKNELGSFTISRTYDETKLTAQYLQVNPDNLTTTELNEEAQGVKSCPILTSEPRQKLIDATHSDINLGNFFKKIIICEMARLQTWEIKRDVKEMFDAAEKQLNDHLTETIGIVPKLMMPGNFARDLFDERKASCFLQLIPDENRKEHLAEVLCIFRRLRTVYRAHHPDAEDVANYKQHAVQMGHLMMINFSYVAWPNYFHKIIEHVQEIIQDPEGPHTIGGISGEGNEAANKLFRELRGHFARKHDEFLTLRDVMWYHWLYTSPKLRRISHVNTRQYQCSNCKELGHNVRSCQNAKM